MIDIGKLRRETPGVAHRVHLNNAGAALMPTPVLDAVKTHLDREAMIGGYEAAEETRDQHTAVYDSVARLIESFPVFKAKAEELSERYPELDDRSPGRHLSSLAAYPVAMAEIQAVIGAYGFDDIETYMRTLQTAAMTAAILDLEAERGMSLQEQIDAQVQQLQNNPQIPENMRAQVLQMLEAQLEQVRRMEPLPGNREAVAPHAAELRALLDDPEQPR